MSERVIEWNGISYDLDPTELTMGEFEEIAKRGGPDGLHEMLAGLRAWKPTAWKGLFWVQDRRRDPGLEFGSYAGPTARVILDGQAKLLDDEPEAEQGKGEAPSGTAG